MIRIYVLWVLDFDKKKLFKKTLLCTSATRFFVSNTFISNATLRLAKN